MPFDVSTWEGDGLTTPLTPPGPFPPSPRLLRDAYRPAISVDRTAWNHLPVFSYSPSTGLWFAKLPGTVWGTTRPAAFRDRGACLRWLQREYRALWGLSPETPVEVRYEPPMRRRRLTPAELAAHLAGQADRAARLARWIPDTLPGQFRSLPPTQRAAVQNALQALEQARRESPDDYLEARRAARTARPAYAGARALDEAEAAWPTDGLAVFFITPLQRDGERPLYAPWVRLADGRVHARWAFLTPAAAERFCYDHGAWWVERRRSRAVQARDRVQPLPLYVDPAVLAAAARRLRRPAPPRSA